MATLKRPSLGPAPAPAGSSDRPALTPAMTYRLMTGTDPGVRLPGWLAAANAGFLGDPTPADVWAGHAPHLIAEAAAAGFAPFWQHKRRPSGTGFESWRKAFLDAHRY